MDDQTKLPILKEKMKDLEEKRDNAENLEEYRQIGCEMFSLDLKIQACKNRLNHKKPSSDQFACRKDLKAY